MFIFNHEGQEYPVSKPDDIKDVPTAALLATYNELSGKDVKRFSTRGKLEAAVAPLILSMGVPEAGLPEKGRRSLISKDATITVISTVNPKRAGSSAFRKFELYEDGMTVAAYLEAGGSVADLRWDKEKGFIEIND